MSDSLQSEAIVHFGLPKTGTTSFQQALLDQRDQLRERSIRVLEYDGRVSQRALSTRAFDLANSVVRPQLDSWWTSYLPEAVLPEFRSAGLLSIRSQVESAERLLVASCEDLALVQTSEELERLKEIMKPRKVTAVIVLRKKSEYRRSLKQQLTRAGIPTFSEYSQSCSNLKVDSWLFDFDNLLATIRETLGFENVIVVDYDESVKKDNSVLPALWKACSLPADLLTTELLASSWRNVSPKRSDSLNHIDLNTIHDIEKLRDIALLLQEKVHLIDNSDLLRLIILAKRLKAWGGRHLKVW